MTAAMVDGQVYEVGVRKVLNRPDWVTVERLRFAGIVGDRTRWLPEFENLGQPIRLFAIEQIASLKEATT